MPTRSLLFALVASAIVLALGAAAQDAVTVVGGMLSTVVAGVWLVIRLDDTSKPVNVLLTDDRLVLDDSKS